MPRLKGGERYHMETIYQTLKLLVIGIKPLVGRRFHGKNLRMALDSIKGQVRTLENASNLVTDRLKEEESTASDPLNAPVADTDALPSANVPPAQEDTGTPPVEPLQVLDDTGTPPVHP